MKQPPQPKKVEHVLEMHQHRRVDSYYWMRDDSRSDPEVIAHLQAENAYTDSVLADAKAIQAQLFEEHKARVQPDDESVPFLEDDYYYWHTFKEGAEHPCYWRRSAASPSSAAVCLFDANQEAKGHSYYEASSPMVSHQGNQFAIAEDITGRRIDRIRFYHLDSGTFLEDVIEQTSGEVVWLPGDQAVLYVKQDPQTLLADKVYLHRLGAAQSEDLCIFEEHDKSYYTYIEESKDRTLISIIHTSTETTYASRFDDQSLMVQPLLPQDEGLKHYAYFHQNDCYILTNWQADNFQVMVVPNETIHDRSTWMPFIEGSKTIFIESIEVLQGHVISIVRERGDMQMWVYDLASNQKTQVVFEDPMYSVRFGVNCVFVTDVLRLHYSSLIRPSTVYDLDLNQGKLTQLKQRFAGADFDPSLYTSERVWVKARDGAEVPVSLVWRKDQFVFGTNPIHIYGYGAYGFTLAPDFRASYLSLMNRGFVMAIVHVRGSEILGRAWYDDGRLHNKKNSFNDFVDATQDLVAKGYGHQDKVFAEGGSAGGLLMGAVINQAPELYLGVIAAVPFVDVLTTMLDTSLPLTTNEYDEWGNPEYAEDYHYILSYSPYDQVQAQAYPNLLVTTGFHDSQVQYFEPAKWVAKIRDHHTGQTPILLQTNMDAGHSGDAGRYQQLKEVAFEQAFLLHCLQA